MSLVCPLSSERIKVPARGKRCHHLACFDLTTYLDFSEQSGYWQCPICIQYLPFEEIYVDISVHEALTTTSNNVLQIKVAPDGKWSDDLTVVSQSKSAQCNTKNNLIRTARSSASRGIEKPILMEDIPNTALIKEQPSKSICDVTSQNASQSTAVPAKRHIPSVIKFTMGTNPAANNLGQVARVSKRPLAAPQPVRTPVPSGTSVTQGPKKPLRNQNQCAVLVE